MGGRAWLVSGAAALIAGALWLRVPSVPYLAYTSAATVITLLLLPAVERSTRSRATVYVALLVCFSTVAARTQLSVWRVDNEWLAYRNALRHTAARVARDVLEREISALRIVARRSLDAPVDRAAAFRALEPLGAAASERGVVLYRGETPVAWAGQIRTPTADAVRPVDATFTDVYLVLRATAIRGADHAVAVSLVHAEPPADSIAHPLDVLIARRLGVPGFEYSLPGASAAADAEVIRADRIPVLVVAASSLTPAAVRLRLIEEGRVWCGLALALALAALIATAWRRSQRLRGRLGVLAAGLAAVALAPFNDFSNETRLFDPAVYFASFGGPFTANMGALLATAALVLLAILTVQRARPLLRSRRWTFLILLAMVALAPFLLRNLARGISAPVWGTSIILWLAWQGTLFLSAMVILVATITLGRALVGHARGISPAAGPAIAMTAALLGPLLWRAPSGWPDWYVALWVAAIGLLALARRTRLFLIAATIVAGTGASTLVWGATARRRAELGARDVAGLLSPDAEAATLATRLGARLAAGDAPKSRIQLLQILATSELAAAGYPTHLAAWKGRDTLVATLAPAPFGERWDDIAALAEVARVTRVPQVATSRGAPGVHVEIAVPHEGGGVTTIVAAPRSRLIPDSPFGALIGLRPVGSNADPPYTITLADADSSDAALPMDGRWERRGSELHGDWLVRGASRVERAHVEVDLRSLGTLVQRGALLVLYDLVLIALIWIVAASAGGGLSRWARARLRVWARSYRARLTIALFGFFLVPDVLFAAWSYQRLLADDRQSRELLVLEGLRAAGGADDLSRLRLVSERYAIPLMLYRQGELVSSSDELYDALAPVGRFLPPDVMLTLDLADEITASRSFDVARERVLIGYRAGQGSQGERFVLAAPARPREVALDHRRRDLGILVLFATAMGALAALWLSGVAARELAAPIGALRRAALDLAAGVRTPALGPAPQVEFEPVFQAFSTMATDLDSSRRALEDAERRIAAVLRDVASGVLAIDPDGRVSLANPRAEALLHASLAPGVPLRTADGALAQRVHEFLAGGVPEEEFDVDHGGSRLHGRLTRLERGGGGAVLTLDDVTELARAQRVLAWGEMAQQVAHEIKNPLTPIRLGVQHLRRARRDGRVDFDRVLEQNVERILAEIDRLDEIARAFSRYGVAPHQQAPAQPTDVAEAARETVELELMGSSEHDPVEWRLEGADESLMALARKDELREVLLNVMENSRHAKARVVTVRVSRVSLGIVISVSDDGTGIPEDVLPRVFEPHFSTRTSGSGLGLAISRRLVEGWGGTMRVTSHTGRGTTVEIMLAGPDATGDI